MSRCDTPGRSASLSPPGRACGGAAQRARRHRAQDAKRLRLAHPTGTSCTAARRLRWRGRGGSSRLSLRAAPGARHPGPRRATARARRSPARMRQSLQTRRDRSAASPPRTGMTSRHLGVIGAPGPGPGRPGQPATDGFPGPTVTARGRAQRRDHRLAQAGPAMPRTRGCWARERRHDGTVGDTAVSEDSSAQSSGWLRAAPTCHHRLIGHNPEELTAAPARPGSAETPAWARTVATPVSYTHLTLPTILRV